MRHYRTPIGIASKCYRMRDLAQDSGEYLSALHNLHTLKLVCIMAEEAQFSTCFSAFRETLTCLSLVSFVTSFGVFVRLVDYFPNITTLYLNSPELGPDEGPVPSLSRPLRGKVHIYNVQASNQFFDQFSKLNLEYEELVIDSPTVLLETKFVETSLKISASTIERLRMGIELWCE